MAFTDSSLALSMNAHVLMTMTSAVEASAVSSCPAPFARPSITSPSTRFFGQPSETNPMRIQFSWMDSVDHPRVRNRFAQVVQAADPGDHALDAHAKAAVGHAAEATQIEIPLKGFLWQLVVLDALLEHVEV